MSSVGGLLVCVGLSFEVLCARLLSVVVSDRDLLGIVGVARLSVVSSVGLLLVSFSVGHSSIETTRLYIKLDKKDMIEKRQHVMKQNQVTHIP